MKPFIVTVLLICVSGISSTGQEQNFSASPPRVALERVTKRPELGVDYSLVVKLKLASRKNTYRAGEMIVLDLALLNKSDKRIYFHSLAGIQLQVMDESNKKIDVTWRLPFYSIATPNSYLILKPAGLTNRSYLLLVGCQGEDVDLNEATDLGVFEKELFVNRGAACINISRAGEYTIAAKLTNQFVVLSEEGNIKTAVGSIFSPAFTIRLIE